MTRKAVVAGQFYSGRAPQLNKELDALIDDKPKKISALGAMVPHAGYMYSGPVAGKVYGCLRIKPTVIILGTNHTGYGEQFSLMSTDSWSTPLGDVAVDKELSAEIIKTSRLIKEDKAAHTLEHSIEVQVPFLQKLKPDVRIVPIVISHADIDTLVAIGIDIAKAIKVSKKDCMVISSSDMTHYEDHKSAKLKDSHAIDAILRLDERELMKTVARENITMCGAAPTASMLACCKELGAKKAELVIYQTSGDISGDFSSVVGYAGIVIT